MAIRFEFETDSPELAKHLREISEKVMPAEAAKALNRTVTYVRNEASEQIAAKTSIRKTIIRRRIKAIKRFRASSKKLSAVGFVGEATIPVSKLTPKPKKAGRGVTYKTVTGQAVNPKAFFAKMPSGHKSAFARLGATRKSHSPKGTSRLRQPIYEEQVDIKLIMRRTIRGLLRRGAPEFFEKTFFENMKNRTAKDLAKRGFR